MKRAFTLIELLVVIAIIAILAAILFPVFAEAKTAAKKAASLTQEKQVNLATQMYLSDSDDVYPLAFAHTSAGWLYDKPNRFPYDWHPDFTAEQKVAFASVWANAILPYAKSVEVFRSPGDTLANRRHVSYDVILKPLYASNFGYNGLLTEYSATAIASPSQLTTVWQPFARTSFRGYAMVSPYLGCDHSEEPCRYIPGYPGIQWLHNGEWSYITTECGNAAPEVSLWAYGHGQNFSFADGSAKFRQLGGNLHGLTNYRVDPFLYYDEQGFATGSWFDSTFSHPTLFRPDFDFADFTDQYIYQEDPMIQC